MTIEDVIDLEVFCGIVLEMFFNELCIFSTENFDEGGEMIADHIGDGFELVLFFIGFTDGNTCVGV